MSDDDRLAEQILDLVVYAPIGLALEARELLPKLADRGRGQVALTRLAGKVASDRGGSEMRGIIDQVISVVGTVLASETGDPPPPPHTASDGDADDPVPLPIDAYDSFTAPQLLQHLPPLSADELSTVLSYEQNHRSRATVINRIRQLQG